MATARVAFAAITAAALGGCAIFPPVGEMSAERVRLDWANPLYELEAFAYEPMELGRSVVLRGDATPANGLVVIPTKDRHVRGLDAGTGELLWELQTSGPNEARPASYGDDVVVGSMDGHVYKLRQRSGRAVWTSEWPGNAINTAPAIADDKVFVTSIDNRITALSFETGEKLWDRRRPHTAEFTITGQAGMALVDDAVITGFSDGFLVAYAREDGATLWSLDLSGPETEFIDVDTTPLIVGDLVVAGCYKRGLFGVDKKTGDVRWWLKGEAYLTPAELDGVLYVPQANGRVVAVDAADGQVRWVSVLRSGWVATPTVSRKYVLVPSRDALVVLDRGTGRAILTYDDGRGFSATPTLFNGTAYAMSNSGTLYALGLY